MNEKTLKVLLDSRVPVVMGIVNVTPDSFYAPSRQQTTEAAVARARQLVAEGADILDIGACSTRPGAERASEEEELERLLPAVEAIHEALPDVPLSIDTFRASVAKEVMNRMGSIDPTSPLNPLNPIIINDISGGEAALPGMPYILTCPTAQPEAFFEERLPQLAAQGVTDVILDPGFGFGKTVEENFSILSRLSELRRFGKPLLVGVSRKSMICKTLAITPEEALNGTTVLHTYALLQGATILRVHDVREAVECRKLVACLTKTSRETIESGSAGDPGNSRQSI